MRAPIQFGQLRTSQSSPTPTPRKTGSAGLLSGEDAIQEIAQVSSQSIAEILTSTPMVPPTTLLHPFSAMAIMFNAILDMYRSRRGQQHDYHQIPSLSQVFPSTPSSVCRYIVDHSLEFHHEMTSAKVNLPKDEVTRGKAVLSSLALVLQLHISYSRTKGLAWRSRIVCHRAKTCVERYAQRLSGSDTDLDVQLKSLTLSPHHCQNPTETAAQPSTHHCNDSPTSTDQGLPQHTPDPELQRTRSAEEEVERLRRELAYATQTIANQEVELEQNRIANLTMEHVVGSPAPFEPRAPVLPNNACSGKRPMNVDPFARRPANSCMDSYQGGVPLSYGESSTTVGGPGIQDIWSNGLKPGNGMNFGLQHPTPQFGPSSRQASSIGQMNALWNPPTRSPSAQTGIMENGGVSLAPDVRSYHTFIEPQQLPDPSIRGGGLTDMIARPVSALSTDSRWYATGWTAGSRTHSPPKPQGQNLIANNTRPVDLRMANNYASLDLRFARSDSRSPKLFDAFDHAAPFQGAWNASTAMASSSQNYINPNEPMNYRRLLDKNMSCDWKFVVDKIVCNNDQQASIFLQQKLKLGTQEQKFEIVQSIIAQALSLMTNRFGNFLVQRCFEHGTPEQIEAIAKAICGNTLNLSMDPFGCHVVQKALDCVPEAYKAIMVHELLRRIPDTVIHRYACHVWQKLFELRWSDSPPQIMKYVNEALRGMWHEVALGETGSLVVQNIFENCLEEDKRPCINEVLSSIDIIAHGQFGNWCIQHICEHGAVPDRTRAIDHILRFATEYSTDQYASKVIEKCLKIGSNEFLDKYLERVCQSRADRPRIPLIDIAGDQFGNYLIQWVLTNSSAHHREIVAAHIRKHMVSLRGSKYGSRVAMLCSNPANQIRPGPPTGLAHRGYSSTGTSSRAHYAAGYR